MAIITGAASGIGEATARTFVEHGAFVVVADIHDDLGQQVVESIGSDKATYKHCNVKNEKEVEETVAFAIQKYGSLDIMFSNAGVLGLRNSILDLDAQDFEETMAVNVRGSAFAIKHAAKAMVAGKIRGSIMCTASIEATLATGGPAAYMASKHAVLGLVKAAAVELGEYGIRVNCISPAGIATPMVSSSSRLAPEELRRHLSDQVNLQGESLNVKHVAEAALFLACNESAYISAHDLAVDGGISARSIYLK